jgi:asparagine synthase (glutamine-hydrolysing)
VIDDYVLSERAASRGLFDQTFVRRVVTEHQSGARNHSERLWSLVNFEMWMRQFIDGGAEREHALDLAESLAVVRP